MPRPIHESVVVVTGASSGIGKATALELAARGASVVLAARREEELEEARHEVEQRGEGGALAVPTDVTSEAQVERLAQRAVETFGRIDAWVNNAAVGAYGRIEDTATDVFRRVLDTNVMGYVHGTKAALARFRLQGSGVLVFVDSLIVGAPQPYSAPYGMSKAAIRSFAESLRMELLLDGARGIHVCTVLPATIDTPFFHHAANYTGRVLRALPPVYPPEQVARTIVRLMERPRREVFVGRASRLGALQHTLAPGLYQRVAARQIDRHHLVDRPAEETSGNVFEPMRDGGGVSGGWKRTGPAVDRALLGLAAAVPAAVLLWARGR